MPQDDYLTALAEYYNGSRLPSKPGAAAGFPEAVQSPDHWAHQIAADLTIALAEKRVLEVACGNGRWTQIAARAAKHITATDIAQNLLDNAMGLPIPPGKVDFIRCDAFDIATIAGPFWAGLHMNFINHLPLDTVPRFLDAFHSALGQDATVICGSQKFRGSANEPVYERPGTSDICSMRHNDAGDEIEVIDTLFTEDLLRGLLAGRAADLQFSSNPHWWWAKYAVR